MGTFGKPRDRRGGWKDRASRGGHAGGPLRPVFDDHERFGDKPDYKTAALCKQVRRVVSLALAGECGDPVLQSLIVDDVLPAPNAGRLLVRAFLPAGVANVGVIDVLQRLAAVEGVLRASVAEGISRKRTPELVFDIVVSPVPMQASQNEEVPHE